MPPRTASPHTARLINDRAAFDLLLEHGHLSRAELQQRTGLSRATIGDLVDRLEAGRLITPVGESPSRRRGPNAVLYGLVADRAHVAGVEVRPGEVLASVNDLTGGQVGFARGPLDPAAEPDRLVHDTIGAALADARLGADRLDGVVIGTPGLIDPETGDVAFVGALPTWHANLLPGLRARLGGLPVLVENEVNLAGLAEHRLGAARGEDTFALISLDAGVGMAIVLGGRLHRGRSGGAGEISYLPASLDGAAFPHLVSGPALLALAAEHGVAAPGAGGRLAGEDLATVVRKAPGSFLDVLAERIAFGALAVCAVLDPGCVILAGPVGRAGGEELAARVEERLAGQIPLPTRVVPGTVEGDAVLRGAVLVALERLYQQMFR
ncbi:ROK family transcriptional regulator [Nonomuraea typhae]|uniref:ROK family transcriptional regulator n=1 Tax=Nonomuraea typhae TaxID=2603600 RepID=UPI0012F7BFF5|nr:ROK family transcriptional regulator [Nonomuraea typhae]